jgi:hypothetical protein
MIFARCALGIVATEMKPSVDFLCHTSGMGKGRSQGKRGAYAIVTLPVEFAGIVSFEID